MANQASTAADKNTPQKEDIRLLDGRMIDERVRRGIHPSINGIAAGLRNTG